MNSKWAGRLFHVLGLAATLGAVAIAIELFYLPMEAESARLVVEGHDELAYLKTSEKINGNNRSLKQELSDLESQLARLHQKIPDSPQEADFLAQLAEAADNSHIELRDYRPAGISRNSRHSEQVIHVLANGTYTGLCQFLDRIEHLPRLCHVTTLNINAEHAAFEPFTINLTLRVFFAPDRPLDSRNAAAEEENG